MARSTKNWDEDDVKINKSRQFGSTNKARPRTKDRPDYSKAKTGTIIEVDRGRVQCLISENEGQVVITAMKARELGKKSVVVGDLVSIVGDTSGNVGSLARVVTVLPRKNSLTRTIDDHANDERVIVANVDPVFKIDKSSDLSDLRNVLSKKITVLLGHSGVGKSTLVNNLLINSKNKFIGHDDESTFRETGDVNEVTGRGRHTSSSAIALPLSSSFSGENFGWIIDTPGVRSFGVAHVQPSRVIAAFPEFAEPVSMCPKNCSHNEQSCALNSWDRFNDKNHARLASLRRVLSTK